MIVVPGEKGIPHSEAENAIHQYRITSLLKHIQCFIEHHTNGHGWPAQ